MLLAKLLIFPVALVTCNPDLLTPVPFNVKPQCFGRKNRLGCFDMTAPWVTRVHPQPPPMPPHLMAVRVFFHSRPFVEHQHEIITYPSIDLRGSPFNSSKMTFFITHGFQNTGKDKWVGIMKNAILNATDANVFIGEWGGGAKVLSYIQDVGNTRLAARQFSNLFQYLIDQQGLNTTNIHLIGHSLGAQICGLIGKSIPGIFQITALDPAQPLYDTADISIRLNKGDAAFVMGVHSDAKIFLPDVGFGFMEEIGHVDFYINGAHNQPMCQYPALLDVGQITNIFDFFKPLYQVFLEVLLCPHQSAVDIFTEAIQGRTCIFWGHAATMSNAVRAESNVRWVGFFSQFVSADDAKCGRTNCSPLGLNTYFWPARGTFTLMTRGNSPYCIYEESIVNLTSQRDLIVSVQNYIITRLDPYDSLANKEQQKQIQHQLQDQAPPNKPEEKQ